MQCSLIIPVHATSSSRLLGTTRGSRGLAPWQGLQVGSAPPPLASSAYAYSQSKGLMYMGPSGIHYPGNANGGGPGAKKSPEAVGFYGISSAKSPPTP